MYSEQQKHESRCLLSESVSCISPEPLELQKSYLHIFASSFRELSDEIRIFSNPVTKSADICQSTVLTEKSKLLEKIRHFEKFKNFFSWMKCL